MDERGAPGLRRAALAAAVLHDVDLVPLDDGVLLADRVHVPWHQLVAALRLRPVGDPAAPALLARWLRLRLALADRPPLLVADEARVVGLPVGHALHPGTGWVRERVPGGVLDLGLGVRGLDPADPEAVVVVPASAWRAAAADGHDADALWEPARERLERWGAVAAERLLRDPQRLRPVGDADALTLLGSAAFRTALAAGADGLAAVAVPTRRSGWLRLSALDPAFVGAVAATVEPADRGFPRAVLVTADEVVLARAGSWATRAAVDGRLPAGDTPPALRAG